MAFKIMDFNSRVLGNMGTVMRLRSLKQNIIANNISNADTPGYQARDFSIREVMGDDRSKNLIKLSRTNPKHIEVGSMSSITSFDLKYRVPFQKTLDGNTVETQVEGNKFAENALRYQATVDFLGGRIKKIKEILGGNY